MPPQTLRQQFTLLRKSLLRPPPHIQKPHPHPRLSSSSNHQATSKQHTRLTRLLAKLPPSLRPYTQKLLTSPTTHIVSFLILHELTAILPLIGLTITFHTTNLTPTNWLGDKGGEYVREGVERFGRWFGRKGWFGFSVEGAGSSTTAAITSTVLTPAPSTDVDASPSTQSTLQAGKETAEEVATTQQVEERFNVSSASSKILIEVATAYAITKVLLPVRIMASVWATPWLARVVVGRFGGLFSKGKAKVVMGAGGRSGAAGTGSTAGGVVGKGS